MTENRSVRALLVGAVSTKDRGQTAESQLGALREVGARKGWVMKELSFTQSRWDEESAAEVRHAIMAELETGAYDVLATWALDRLTRQGPEAALRLIRTLENHHAVRFFSLQEPFLCTESAGEQRELLLPLLAWVAKWDSGRKSQRVRARVQNKREASAKLGISPKWARGKLASDEQIARAREMSAAGYSVRAIAAETGMSKSSVARAVPNSRKGQHGAGEEKQAPVEGSRLGQHDETTNRQQPDEMSIDSRGDTPRHEGVDSSGGPA